MKHQPKPSSKHVKGVKKQPSTSTFPVIPIMIDGNNLIYVKSFKYLKNKVNLNATLDKIMNYILTEINAFEKHHFWDQVNLY